MEYVNEIRLCDCRQGIASLQDKSVALIVTDPPYYILNQEGIKCKNRADIKLNADFDTQFTSVENYLMFMEECIRLLAPKMADNSFVYMFTATQYSSDILHLFEKYGFVYFSGFYWIKTNPAPQFRKSNYISAVETVLIVKKGNPHLNFGSTKDMHNTIRMKICSDPERIRKTLPNEKGEYESVHPTQKPVKLIEKLITDGSQVNDLVVDLFAGVGTTNVACYNLKRQCVSFEINKEYYTVGVDRLQHVEGRTPLSVQKKLSFT